MKKIKNYQDFTNEEINLKKALAGAALGAGLSISNPVISQDVKSTNLITPTYTTTPYDSSSNYISAEFNNFKKSKSQLSKLIGQTLFLKPEYDSDGNLDVLSLHTDFYADGNNKNQLMIDSLIGQYFIVDDIIQSPTNVLTSLAAHKFGFSVSSHEHASNNLYPYLVLRERNSGNIYYFQYKIYSEPGTISYSVEDDFPFIIGGFYIKQSHLLTGSELVVKKYSDGSGSYNYVDLIKNGKKINKKNLYIFRNSDAPRGEYGPEYSPDFDKMKVGSKFKFVGLIVDVNQIYSPLCLEFESSDGLKILVKYDEVFDTDDNGSGVSYPSSYYTYNITVNFYINVNIYR